MTVREVATFALHDWNIALYSDAANYPRTLELNLPQYFDAAGERLRDAPTFKFIFASRAGSFLRLRPEEESPYHRRHLGILRQIDLQAREARIERKAGTELPSNRLYHACFLQPLSIMLRTFGCTLVHASLVSKGNRALLVVGEKGTGKSTLSLSFLEHGYRYYSDEHPILSLSGRAVHGLSLVNQIAVEKHSKHYFPHLEDSFRWVPSRRKYYLDPRSRSWACGVKKKITAVLFPTFRADAAFSCRELGPREVFCRLLRDEYFRFDTRTVDEVRLNQMHLTLFERLAGQAAGYEITYGTKDVLRFPELVERYGLA